MSCLEGEEDEEQWSHDLCCVYTHVEIMEDASTPYLKTYDGNIEYMDPCDITGAVSVMKTAWDNICDMSMGEEDCNDSDECKAEFD